MIDAPSQPTNPSLRIVALGLVLFALVMSVRDGLSRQSADLFALWLAGDFMAMGRPDQVYPTLDGVFLMRPPVEWLDHIASFAPEARLFPYIYPPLWAKLASGLTPHITFQTFDIAMLALHQTLLMWGAFLAVRMGGFTGDRLWFMAALTYAMLVLTMPIGIALTENQPQITVSFLIVAAFAQVARNHPRTGGALLALAASIKVYPVLFMVIFIGRRQWRALGSFTVAGGALAALSVGLNGWALHAEFLHLLGTVSQSVVVSTFSFSIDAAVAISAFAADLVMVDQANPLAEVAGWSVAIKTAPWAILSSIVQIIALIGIGVLAAKRRDDPLILACAAMILALLSPLSWAYTYLTSLFFLIPLAARLGRTGIAIAVVFFAALHPSVATFTVDLELGGIWAFWLIGMITYALITAAFFTAIWKRRTGGD